jgi:signal transduction histidine kinase
MKPDRTDGGERSLLHELSELERRTRQLEAIRAMVEASYDDDQAPTLVPRLLQILCTATASATAALYRADPSGKTLVLEGATVTVPQWFLDKYRTLPIEGTLNGVVASTKRPVKLRTEDLPPSARDDVNSLGHLHTMLMPLVANDRLIGTINISRETPEPYSEDDVSSMSVLCGQMSVQLERARLRQETLRRIEELSLINEVGGLISQQLDLERVFETAVHHVCRVVDVDVAYLWLANDKAHTLEIVASNASRGMPAVHISLDQPSVAAVAFHTQQPVAIPDLENDPRISKALLEAFRHRRLMAAPLISQGRSIGVLVLGDGRAQPFAEGQLERTVAVANQLASAIHNARLYADLRASYEELHRAQETLVRKERLAALGELAAVVAHEVRNPLGVIFNSLASLHRMPLADEPKVLMRIMAEESERLNRMVSDLLEFARPHELELAPTGVDELVKGALESAARATGMSGIAVQLAIPTDLPQVRIDAQQMRRAVLNLILNSVQAMPQGGDLAIRARLEPRSSAPVVRLEVSDAGPGIPEDLLHQIFQPFFTTKASGTGLGLAVVKSIVDAHQVEIAVQSQGRGATFALMLPVDS